LPQAAQVRRKSDGVVVDAMLVVRAAAQAPHD
jgi:hypothetical protein